MSRFAVTVVIPLYNKAAYIRQTLKSAIGQTHLADEIVIVDDSSNDGSVAAIRDLLGSRVRLVRQANAGPGPARNRGVAEAKSEWIAFLDADDVWRPEHLATLGEVAAAFPSAAAVASRHERIKSDGIFLSVETAPRSARLIQFFLEAKDSETLHTSAVAVRRKTLSHAGGFGAFCPGEDLDLWIRIALEHDIARSERITTGYRQHTGGLMNALDHGGSFDAEHQPMFATLAAALAATDDPARQRDIRDLRDSLLINSVKQELYRGECRAARLLIRDCDRVGAAAPRIYRLLAWLPSRLAVATIRIAVRLRRPFTAPHRANATGRATMSP